MALSQSSARVEDEIFPVSDEKYAEELQLQEVLMSSATSCSRTMTTTGSPKRKNRTLSSTESLKINKAKMETGQCSHELCLICRDAKPGVEMFRNSSCSHSFCNNCISKYIATKIQENISKVECPDPKCKCLLEPQLCRSIVPKHVFDRWENAICEALVLGEQKFYCPFKDCSAFLVDDGKEVVTVSECPNCHRLFCAQCKVSWHNGMQCKEFQKLGKEERGREDIMVMELVKMKKWRRCPSCKFYVEKISGCIHIKCRCGYEFCYACGSKWAETHVCRPARVRN